MKNDFYLSYIDEMTHEERSIFLYRFILKLTCTETGKRLKMPIRKVKLISDQFKKMLGLAEIKKYVLEASGVLRNVL
jgi:DNA-directed RNA polymerase specialized sigma24 family protein